MFLLDGTVITSASDLTNASKCEFAFLRALDAKLGRIEAVPDPEDAMLDRTARLGDRHEDRVLQGYRDRYGSGVVEIARPNPLVAEDLLYATDATRAAFASGADVVFQATFFDGGFLGYADFIVLQPGGRYLVQDTKLARRARVTALLQVVAYVGQLEKIGVPVAPTVQLLLGDGSVSEHRVSDILPVYRKRRERLLQIVAERQSAAGPVEWGDPRYTVCGRCASCSLEVDASRDVLLVAGMRIAQRDALTAAGITTIDQLAELGTWAAVPEVSGMARSTLEGMSVQARLQVQAEQLLATARQQAEQQGANPDDVHAVPPVEVRDPRAIAAVPEANAGDLFFDFEGDPLYTEGAGVSWGLDYLFGVLDTDETFSTFWAHSFAEEKVALERFLDFVDLRRQAHPGLHIYHYASYERTHLLSIAARHGTCEARVDQLLNDGVLIDLYPVVRRALLIGSRSYSIKKLEPLYMGDDEREGVTNAADSIIEYQRASALAAAGDVAEAQAILDDIARYNRYDVLSTLRLRDWLHTLAADLGVAPTERIVREGEQYVQSPLAIELSHLAGSGDASIDHRTAEQTALALASAAIDYYQRERKSFWWGHYFRLEQPIREWENTRDVLIVEADRSAIETPWTVPERSQKERRLLTLRGRFGPGSRHSAGAGVFVLYEPDEEVVDEAADPGQRIRRDATIVEVLDDGLVVEEQLPVGASRHRELPVAVVPGWPLKTDAHEAAISEWGERLVLRLPEWPRDPMVDVLRRLPPRTRSGEVARVIDEGYATATVATLLDLDDSYLAVQGPPGTGKTYLASHVIARLVRDHGWKVGVVAQSHSVVENLLDRIMENTDLDPEVVGKARRDANEAAAHSYTVLADKKAVPAFMVRNAATGFVVGGTAWDFANAGRMPRKSLDLLVVDEAGQYSLAATIATSVAARNLLLLGDPQQLPQVSQGTHPEPIDHSALGWVAAGHDVLPSEFGYFLAESRRMHPAVAKPVSALSYEGELRSHPCAAERQLEGVAAGLHPLPVEHSGNSTESPEEADAVVAIVRSVLGTRWSESSEAPGRPLEQDDIIVVTPYNAQLARVRAALDEAGFADVPVGTVDKFQGREAVIALVSLAASSAADVPRGMEFLIMKNRLNVAISRAQWAAWLIHSTELTEFLPHTPQGVADLSAFISLVESRTG
ncbi:TM0106 family RecB-like putative nuclease [Rathayibacter sp. YIM 133350]|uniref:TM0106 family RecB-like putative nuclease n=1 Tax=Rathayibacter sp. YIM 133350 TaxID=3131992 RepID=UPI00307D2396